VQDLASDEAKIMKPKKKGKKKKKKTKKPEEGEGDATNQ